MAPSSGVEPHRLSRRDARRVAVRAQLLDRDRPQDLMAVVRHLGVVQVDLTEHVAPSADLVLCSRLGRAYVLGEVESLLDQGRLVQLRSMIRPAEDVALFRAAMNAWPGAGEVAEWLGQQRDWIVANDESRRDILRVLHDDGPLPATAIPDTTLVPWRSTGWTNDKNVQRMLDLMEARGEVAVAGREGRARLWDLADRVYPEVEAVPVAEAQRELERRRLRALGIARARGPLAQTEPYDAGAAGETAVVEGLRGTWRVDPEQLARLGEPFRGRAALLSPLDRLVFERTRMEQIFGFDYQLEMYKPKAKRRWGYYALPVLYGDRLVGKLDAEADRKAGVLRVHRLHEDEPLSRTARGAVEAEIRSLAAVLELDVVRSEAV